MDSNKIYYKGNPFTSKDYIPSSAMKNRKTKNFLVELPQGDEFFGFSRKKQYVNLHNQSQIKDKSVLVQNEQQNYAHNNLEIRDIEGAVPNTIISQALRNRIKGKSNFQRKQKFQLNTPKNTQKFYEKIKASIFPTLQNGYKNSPNFHFRNQKSEEKHFLIQPQYQENLTPRRLKTQNYEIVKNDGRNSELQKNASLKKSRIKQLSIKELHDEGSSNFKKFRSVDNSQKRINQENSYTASPKKQEIERLWHGDTRRIQLIPLQKIRKNNPTYLSNVFNNPQAQ